MNSLRAVLVLALMALVGGACSHDIGDGCQTSVDCDPSGTRSCDLSQPGGYCTINGCDETTCPSGATCVRYFPAALLDLETNPSVVHCSPACEDLDCALDAGATDGGSKDAGTKDAGTKDAGTKDAGTKDAGASSGRRDDCTPNEVCLDEGICAKRSYEQRECAKVCSSNSDCRNHYVCRETGMSGSMPLSANPLATTKFCAPDPNSLALPLSL